MTRAPESLCRRLTRETLILLLVFQLMLFAVGGKLIVWPLLNTATADLARVMEAAAARWPDASPNTGPTAFRDADSALWMQAQEPVGLRRSYLPYAYVLSRTLSARAGETVDVKVDLDGRYWARLPARGGAVWTGFDIVRLGTRPPLMLMLLVPALIGLALAFSVLVARRMTRPLSQLIAASARLGRGETGVRVGEDGPREIAALAQAFNTLAGRLRELLDNRTTLLVGLSHDLRTPLTRLRLALEMLGDSDAELVAGMQRDLDALNALLDDVFALERGLHLEQGRRVTIETAVTGVVAAARQAGHAVDYDAVACDVEVSDLALTRVLENLVQNALRYAPAAPVAVRLACRAGGAVVEVADRGPGIPADQRAAVLRPFYRLDASRSAAGGSGLGLAIVQQICRAQGWEIELGDRDGGGLRAVLTIAAR